MATKKNQSPLVCSCGGASFRETKQGGHECSKCGTQDPSNFTLVDMPEDAERDIQQLISDRLSEEKRSFDADKLNKDLCVRFNHSEPVAIVAFGDPHLDDRGTMLSKVIEDLEYVKQNENVFGVCVGDITNNWVGRLTALHGEQGTTIAESWMLVEWFCREIPWMAMVLGNHDKWNSGTEILKQLTRGKLVQADECSFRLNFKNGAEFSINARHKWSGNSQWNPAHGVAKYAHFGADYDVLMGGHTHQSAYAQVLATRKHKITHCLQLASYKVLDSYARSEGFRNHNITPSMCIVFDPNAVNEEDKVIVTYSIKHGILLHKSLLAKYRKESPVKETPAVKVKPKLKATKKKVR
jgi:UDP-2,3-diacylglucosamine pyrophosphatase LpxH